MDEAFYLLDRAALDIALGGHEAIDLLRLAVDACISAGAPGARARAGALVSESGVVGANPRRWAVDDVELAVAGAVHGERLLNAMVMALARLKRVEERRKILHDVRGLLAVVAGQTEMLSMSVWGPILPAQKKALDAIERQVERMGPLLERLR